MPNLLLSLICRLSIVYFIVYLPFNVRSYPVFTLSSFILTFIGLIFITSPPSIAISINSEGKEEIEKDEPC